MFFIRPLFLFLITIFVSCTDDQSDLLSTRINHASITFAEPQGMEVWIDSVRQNVKLLRLRKANGASRMRFLVELSDSLHLSLFVTPFETGSHPIHTSAAEDDDTKFSRTHLEFKKQINTNLYSIYALDTMALNNQVLISRIDQINQTVTGHFICHLYKLNIANKLESTQVKIWGHFNSDYRD